MEIKPVAYIHTVFKEKFGLPRQSGRVSELTGRVVFEPAFRCEEALRGIEEYSHLWLIFDFSLSHRKSFSPTVRPPRLGGNTRVGVFASRAPFRPNSLGMSAVKLVKVQKTENEGTVLIVSGIDMIDGTPIYDIKPYVPHSDCIADAVGSYSDDFRGHRLNVNFPTELMKKLPHDIKDICINCIAEDPRPGYDDDADKVYHMKVDLFDVHFRVAGDTANIIEVTKNEAYNECS